MNLTKTFLQTLQKGFDAAKLIELPKERAMAYSELAKAIAMTGIIKDTEEMEISEETTEKEVTEKETKKKTTSKKKESLKNEASKTTKKESSEQNIEEDESKNIEEPSEDNELEDQWTDEMSELKAEQVERLKQFVDAWGEDYVYEDCLSAWSEGAFTGVDNVRPTNIDGFVSYLELISSESEE